MYFRPRPTIGWEGIGPKAARVTEPAESAVTLSGCADDFIGYKEERR